MEEFLARLKAHKLVQWTLGYLAVSFALLPVLDIVAERFGWSQTAVRCMIIALGTGFLMMLVIAWYHGERGAQRVTRTEHAILASLLVLGGLAMWRIGPSTARPEVAKAGVAVHAAVAAHTITAEPIATPAPIPAKSIAVLPFENLSTDKGNAYFADGMQDLILTKLADIGDLKVISRTSTAKYESHPDDLKAIGQQLGVATVLEGSVQKAGNEVLINVQLIDANADSHIWAQSYQRTLDNIFGVEGEVAEKVAAALNAKLTTSEKLTVARAPTHNKQALDAYLRGQYYLNHETGTLDPTELKQAIALFEQATSLDPSFVNALNDLSLAYQHLGGHDKQAEIAAKRALALNPHDANAHRMVAYVLAREGKFEQALEHAQEAVRLAPNNAVINNGLGNVYDAAGQIDKAIATYRHALELDSRQNFIRINLADEYMEQRRYADARDMLQTATMVDPSNVLAAIQLAWVQELGWGDLAAARKALQGVSTPIASSRALADAWYWVDMYARDFPAALAVIQETPAKLFESQRYPPALYAAQVYQAQGDDLHAKVAFTKAQTQIEAWLKDAPGSDSLHANLSLTLAGLGHGDDAVEQAQRAVESARASSRDPSLITQGLINLATVDAQVGKTDAAFKLLDELRGKPSGDAISASLLRLDPTWDPIRRDPRFQGLLKRYADTEVAAASPETESAGRSP